MVGGLRPDLTFILDLPVDEGLARAKKRMDAHSRYERMTEAFHERVRQGFLEIARREPERCVVIDAAGDPNRVQAAVQQALDARLGAAPV